MAAPPKPWEPLFHALANRDGLFLVTVSGSSREFLSATLSTLITLLLALGAVWWWAAPGSFLAFTAGLFMALIGGLLCAVIGRWLIKPKLIVALDQQGVIGLCVAGQAPWHPPDALKVIDHTVKAPEPTGSRLHHALHTVGVGAQTFAVNDLLQTPEAAALHQPTERLFDDLWHHACEQMATRPHPNTLGSRWVDIVSPLRDLPGQLLREPILTWYSLPLRPVFVLWRAIRLMVEGVLSSCFAWVLKRHAHLAPATTDWLPPQSPYVAAGVAPSDDPAPLMRPSQATIRIVSHLAHAVLLPGLAMAIAWLLFDIHASRSADIVFIDSGNGWWFKAGLALATLALLAGLGHVIGLATQALADRFALGSLYNEWLAFQVGAMVIVLVCMGLAHTSLSARQLNIYFGHDTGAPIRGRIVATDSFIQQPSSYRSYKGRISTACTQAPAPHHFPPSPIWPAHPSLQTSTRTMQLDDDGCVEGGAHLTLKWTASQDASLVGIDSWILRHRPLPALIPAGLCGRLKVGALGLRYVDQLHGCDPT